MACAASLLTHRSGLPVGAASPGCPSPRLLRVRCCGDTSREVSHPRSVSFPSRRLPKRNAKSGSQSERAWSTAAPSIGPTTSEGFTATPECRNSSILRRLRWVTRTLSSQQRASRLDLEDAPLGVAEQSNGVDGTPRSPENRGKSYVWALVLLCFCYLHHSTAGFALPSFLPSISRDLHLSDTQSSYLSVGYSALYAVALIPAGLLADKFNRINFLAVAAVIWSALTMASSKCHGFEDLLLLRIGFAVVQAPQNPVCFSLIPELFPKHRNVAMAFYNSAIYFGRALSFAALFAFAVSDVSDEVGITMVPVNDFDLSQWSVLYTTGELAAVTPVFDYNFDINYALVAQHEQWRTALFYIGPPGLFLAWLLLLTVEDPRSPNDTALLASSRFFWPASLQEGLSTGVPRTDSPSSVQEGKVDRTLGQTAGVASDLDALPLVEDVAPEAETYEKPPTDWAKQIWELLSNRPFLAVTASATVNDLASWSLVAWQAAFFERVHDIGPEVYAPLLACAIPCGGIFGGVGGALIADKVGSGYGRAWLTSAANLAAAPVLAASLLVDDYHSAFWFLTAGIALSEAWRAPSAVLVREISAESLGATASAIHLCIRNLLGGFGPLAVAVLSSKLDNLNHAMLFIPICYAVSGLLFFLTEVLIMAEDERESRTHFHNSID